MNVLCWLNIDENMQYISFKYILKKKINTLSTFKLFKKSTEMSKDVAENNLIQCAHHTPFAHHVLQKITNFK